MINLYKNIVLDLNTQGDFYTSVGNKPSEYATFVSLNYDDDYLNIFFRCENDSFMNTNTYVKDNDTLFKQEVFEVFIAQDYCAPYNYLEIEINPNNAIFLGAINNPSGMGGPTKSLVMLDDQLVYIKHSVIIEDDSWAGFISVPFSLLSNSGKLDNSSYMVNFFRVILKDKPSILDWCSTVDNSEFICFKSTFSPVKPNFHIIDSFTRLMLK